MKNDFSKISAESETKDFATMTPEECAEYEAWLDKFVLDVARDLDVSVEELT